MNGCITAATGLSTVPSLFLPPPPTQDCGTNGCIPIPTGLSTLPSLFSFRISVKTGVVYNDLCPLPEARYEPVNDLISVYSYLYPVPLTLFPVRTTVQTDMLLHQLVIAFYYLCFLFFSL